MPDKVFSDQKGTKCSLAAGLRPDPLGKPTALPRPPAALRVQTKDAPNVVCRSGSARPRWGSLQHSSDPLAASALDRRHDWRVPRLTPSETEHSGSSLFPIRTVVSNFNELPVTPSVSAEDTEFPLQNNRALVCGFWSGNLCRGCHALMS